MPNNRQDKRASSPSMRNRLFPYSFRAAGRLYLAPFALRCLKTPRAHEYIDCYGRRVLYLRERFPCFDSGDYRHENRYYHYYLIPYGEHLTLVCVRDESDEIMVDEPIDRQWLLNRLGSTGRDYTELLDKIGRQ